MSKGGLTLQKTKLTARVFLEVRALAKHVLSITSNMGNKYSVVLHRKLSRNTSAFAKVQNTLASGSLPRRCLDRVVLPSETLVPVLASLSIL